MANAVNDWSNLLSQVKQSVLAGHAPAFEQAVGLAGAPAAVTPELAALATTVRERRSGKRVDLCSIVNARSGRCAEDCKFCAQSSRHRSEVPTYPMKPVDDIVAAAKRSEENGAHRFCIVTSGEHLDDRDFETALLATRRIAEETALKRCASLGRLTDRRADLLRQAGLNRYHHNVETARSFFGRMCSTHSHDDKRETIGHVKTAGIEPCVGGILNLGETPAQRIEFAFELRELAPVSVPINFLDPRPGTPLADRRPVGAAEAGRYLALLRLILPDADIRLAGGRLKTFAGRPHLPFMMGVDAVLIGDLLTTKGAAVQSDLALLESLGLSRE